MPRMLRIMKQRVVTKSAKETHQRGFSFAKRTLAHTLCLHGELGSGKTTFAQGILSAYGAKKPHTSPTFAIVKTYKVPSKIHGVTTIHHIDTYRISAKDLVNLGWHEMVTDSSALVVIEWPERIKTLIPNDAIWIFFSTLSEHVREIIFDAKAQKTNLTQKQ